MTDQGADNPTAPGPGPKRKPISPSGETQAAPEIPAKKGKKARPEPTTIGGKLWHNWVKPIGSVVIIVVVLRSMLIDWNDVPTGSMEPEIAVGDRIAVNRLAYGLQFPLTGPTIGIPFTSWQWDNPLDFIPQIQWGSPDRGDIVTFWNPVTDVRMVKRIVAIPGDTISMQGGVMTINGTTATYTDVDPAAEGLPLVTKYEVQDAGIIRPERKDLEYQREELLGETRLVQYIKERWIEDIKFIDHPGRGLLIAQNGSVSLDLPGLGRRSEPVEAYLAQAGGQARVIASIRDGAVYVDGKPATYNAFADRVLATYENDGTAEVLKKLGLSIKGHDFLVDGEVMPFEFFRERFETKAPSLGSNDRQQLASLNNTLNILRGAMLTNFGPVTLGEDEYLMVGDNRNNSHDGRMFGPVKLSEITGEAFAVAFSFEDNKIIPPDPNWKRWLKDLE